MAFCAVMHCEFEFPHDPVANSNKLQESPLARAGRNYHGNEVESPTPMPTASTRGGVLEGYFMKSIKGRNIATFEGIPYGETTGGRNRFMVSLMVLKMAKYHFIYC